MLDSDKTVFLTGGSNDNTMVTSDDSKLCMSFDDSVSARDTAPLDGKAKRWAIGAGALLAGAAGLSAWGYQYDVNKGAETLSADGKTAKMNAEYEEISGWSRSDTALMLGLAAGGLASIMAIHGSDITNPAHPSPSGKITVRKDNVDIFAGQGKEAKLEIGKYSGIFVETDQAIFLEGKEGILYKSPKKVTIDAGQHLLVKAMIQHKNLKVLE